MDVDDIYVTIKEPKKFKDGKGDKFIVYVIYVTVPNPFHQWEIIRRFSDFQNLYNFMTSKSNKRHITPAIPSVSFAKHFASYVDPIAQAKRRVPKLQNYLNALLTVPDLTMIEVDILKRFLNFEEYEMFLDMDRNSDVRLSEDFGVANTSTLDMEEDAQVSRILFQDGADSSDHSPSEATDTSVAEDITWRQRDSEEAAKGVICITSTSSDSLTTVETHSKSASSSAAVVSASHLVASQPPPIANSSGRVMPASISPDGKSRIYAITSEGLKEAVRSDDIRGVKELLKINPKLAAYSDSAGNPIIYSAALYGSVRMSTLLIDAGADPYNVNRNGLCSFDIALEPWRHAILEHMVKRKALIQNREALVSVTVKLLKTKYGMGITLSRNPDGHALIVGFKEMPEGLRNPAKSCVPPLEICDVICSVNNMESSNFELTVDAFKGAAVGDLVDVKVKRSLL